MIDWEKRGNGEHVLTDGQTVLARRRFTLWPPRYREAAHLVAKEVGIGVLLLIGPGNRYAKERALLYWKLTELGASQSEIARRVGRHHTSVNYILKTYRTVKPEPTPIPVPDLSGEWAI